MSTALLQLNIRRPVVRDVATLLAIVGYGVAWRLFQITQPFVDAWCWRESDVAMIAENFYRNGYNIFYPQINWAAASSGYIGTEFPLVPFLASLFYPAFGVSEWIGRSVSVAFFAVSVPCLFGIVKKLTNRTAASFAALTYTLAPLSIFASRSFMSDMPTLSLSIVGIYYFMKWLDDETSKSFVLMSPFTSLSILVKLPSAIIGLPLAYMAWQKYAVSFLKSKDLWIFAAISLIPSVCWYTHAHFVATAELVMGSGDTHVFGGDGFGIVSVGAYWRILERTLTGGLTPLVAVGMFAGLFLWPSSRFGRTFHWWLFAIVLFVILAGEENSHPWYQLPIVPVAAAFSGLAFERLLARISSVKLGFALARTVAIALIAALSYSAYVFVRPLYKPWATSYMKAGMAADLITPEGAQVVVAGEGVPTAIYYSKRKGWHFWGPADSEAAIERLEAFREQGATHLVVRSLHFWWLTHYKQFQTYLDAKYQRGAESEDYVILDLSVRYSEEGHGPADASEMELKEPDQAGRLHGNKGKEV